MLPDILSAMFDIPYDFLGLIKSDVIGIVGNAPTTSDPVHLLVVRRVRKRASSDSGKVSHKNAQPSRMASSGKQPVEEEIPAEDPAGVVTVRVVARHPYTPGYSPSPPPVGDSLRKDREVPPTPGGDGSLYADDVGRHEIVPGLWVSWSAGDHLTSLEETPIEHVQDSDVGLQLPASAGIDRRTFVMDTMGVARLFAERVMLPHDVQRFIHISPHLLQCHLMRRVVDVFPLP